MSENALTEKSAGAAIEVRRQLGLRLDCGPISSARSRLRGEFVPTETR
jgi:hypothetical protein